MRSQHKQTHTQATLSETTLTNVNVCHEYIFVHAYIDKWDWNVVDVDVDDDENDDQSHH